MGHTFESLHFYIQIYPFTSLNEQSQFLSKVFISFFLIQAWLKYEFEFKEKFKLQRECFSLEMCSLIDYIPHSKF